MSNSFIQLRRNAYRSLVKKFRKRLRAGAAAYWSEVLLRANYETSHHDGELLERGQFLFGRDELAETIGLTPEKIRTINQHLQRYGELTIKTTRQGSIGTIVHYDTYVGTAATNNQPTNQQITNEQPTNNHSEETNKPIIQEVNVPFEERYRRRRNKI